MKMTKELKAQLIADLKHMSPKLKEQADKYYPQMQRPWMTFAMGGNILAKARLNRKRRLFGLLPAPNRFDRVEVATSNLLTQFRVPK